MNIAHDEQDSTWQRELLRAGVPWTVRLQDIVIRNGDKTAAGLAQEPPPGVDPQVLRAHESSLDLMNDDQQAAVLRRAFREGPQAILRWIESTIAPYRQAVRAAQLDASGHFHLGSRLGLLAKYTRDRRYIDEAIAECRISAELAPGWDAPLVEIGIVLINTGYHQKAVDELDAAEIKLGNATPPTARSC